MDLKWNGYRLYRSHLPLHTSYTQLLKNVHVYTQTITCYKVTFYLLSSHVICHYNNAFSLQWSTNTEKYSKGNFEIFQICISSTWKNDT